MFDNFDSSIFELIFVGKFGNLSVETGAICYVHFKNESDFVVILHFHCVFKS